MNEKAIEGLIGLTECECRKNFNYLLEQVKNDLEDYKQSNDYHYFSRAECVLSTMLDSLQYLAKRLQNYQVDMINNFFDSLDRTKYYYGYTWDIKRGKINVSETFPEDYYKTFPTKTEDLRNEKVYSIFLPKRFIIHDIDVILDCEVMYYNELIPDERQITIQKEPFRNMVLRHLLTIENRFRVIKEGTATCLMTDSGYIILTHLI